MDIQSIILSLLPIKFKHDSFMRSRGRPAMHIIACANCNQYVMAYQKDGPGPLLRCYFDRIHHPQVLAERQHQLFCKNSSPKLICENCKEVIGFPVIYEKENRPAYQMRPGFFHIVVKDACKKKIKK